MASERWQPWRPVQQNVTGSVVLGDIIQIADVRGDVNLMPRREPAYRTETADLQAVPLTVARARAQPSRLLAVPHRIVPFTGRSREVAELAAWVSSSAAVGVRLIHGAGGQGKSRLAAEAALRCAGAGWTVWRVTHTPAPEPHDGTAIGTALLAVVDYADRWPMSALQDLLGRMRSLNIRTGARVRILMLARSAGYWWPSLAGHAERDGIEADETALVPLTSDADIDGEAVFTAAAARFAAALDVDQHGWTVPDLSGPGFASVLAVHMAALVAADARLYGGRPPLSPRSIAGYLLEREQQHWRDRHEATADPLGAGPRALHRATCVATLTGAVPRATARLALTTVDLAADVPGADRIIDDHRACYPPADQRLVLEPLFPDRLGEDLIALSTPGHGQATRLAQDDWSRSAPETLLTSGAGLSERTPAVITVLVETAHRWPHIVTEVLDPLLRRHPEVATAAGGAALIRLAAIPGLDPAVLEAIELLLPDAQHVDLDLAAAAIADRLMPHRLRPGVDESTEAALQARYARRLAHVGRWMEALPPGERAVALLRRRAAHDSGTHLPGLASALTILSTIVSQLGRVDEALALAEEAASIYRRLADGDPGAYRPALADSLAGLGACLAALGMRDDCLAPAEESVSLLRELERADPGRHRYDLALALNNLGAFLAVAGQNERALSLTYEATSLLSGLVLDDPARCLPDLAMALGNLANRMSGVGETVGPLEPAATSVEIYRGLAETNPGGYLAALAASLGNLSIQSAGAGMWGEAIEQSAEAVELYRGLATANPDRYRTALARSLSNHCLRLTELGHWPEARQVAEEAVALHRELMAQRPAAHVTNFASALANLSAARSGSGQWAEALDPAAEAADVWRRLAAAYPEAHLGELAMSLRNWGLLCSRLDRPAEALDTLLEAASMLRGLAAERPAVHRPALAVTLSTLGRHLAEAGRTDEALPMLAEAAELHRRVAEANPEARHPGLGETLRSRGIALSETGASDEALACAEEAVDVYRRLVAAYPERYLADFGGALSHLMIALCDLGRLAQARTVSKEARTVLRRLAHGGDETALRGLGMASTMYAWICLELRRDLMGARAAAAESIRIHTPLAERDPDAFADQLANAYAVYVDALEASGDPQEAEEIRRQVFSGRP